ncbi:MAG: orotate phosphoribosyltransferase [Candidatus Micrarchaeia archaeon]
MNIMVGGSSMKERIADILLEIGAVTLSPEKPYRYASGILSPIYTDCRLLMSHVKEREEVIDAFEKVVRERIGLRNVDCLAAVASSGIPHAAWLADRIKKPMVYVRKEEKDHGKQNLIEGKLEKGARVVVVEDLVSQGGSSLHTARAVRAAGANPTHCVVIFTYQMPKAEEGFRQEGVELIPLTDISTLVKRATAKKLITKEQESVILEWTQDTVGWGKKKGFE